MYRVLSKEEDLSSRQKSYLKIGKWSLFDLWRQRFFLTESKDWDNLVVIELTKLNIEKILAGEKPESSNLSFGELSSLNVNK
ncbi:MAG: hypothetical protein ACD_3C00013G0010 [uncultured bacterium (gcode 4)]|uniref:Uncharacterized protein n=1 Tax=uncultured bacterium (gcode 4) TaxID=1234023 RepID=K2G396_9BACT|nr:MAG: hypothetical protein ACD_3C00013G0010 [uncultured bacterium (gcode 4)]